MTKPIGYYTDKKKRVRPITPRSKRGYRTRPKRVVGKSPLPVLWIQAKKLNDEAMDESMQYQEWAGWVTEDYKIVGVVMGVEDAHVELKPHELEGFDEELGLPDYITGTIHFHPWQTVSGRFDLVRASKGDVEFFGRFGFLRHFIVGEDGVIEWKAKEPSTNERGR